MEEADEDQIGLRVHSLTGPHASLLFLLQPAKHDHLG